MITKELINKGLKLAKKELTLKDQLKDMNKEIDNFFKGIPKEEMFELLLAWKDLDDSIQTQDPIDLSDYEYERTDGSGFVLHSILVTSDNILEVKRFLEEFEYESMEDNSGGIILWKSGSVVTPMNSEFGSYILLFKEPMSSNVDILVNYSPAVFDTGYKKRKPEDRFLKITVT